jgi:hypothetical protein
MCSPTHDTNDLEFRPTCEGDCGTIFAEATEAALTDGKNLWCRVCADTMDREAFVQDVIAGLVKPWIIPAAPRYPAPMNTVQAMALAVEVACGGSNLLSGADEDCDLCDDEPETAEHTAPSMAELMADGTFGRKAAA